MKKKSQKLFLDFQVDIQVSFDVTEKITLAFQIKQVLWIQIKLL